MAAFALQTSTRAGASALGRAQSSRSGLAVVVAPRPAVVAARATRQQTTQLTGLVFQPFNEVKAELATVANTNAASESLARCNYKPDLEAAINEQINIEYTVSYVYHALHAYFDRDNVALPGFAKYFKEASDEERDHAHKLVAYQNQRGGRVRLAPLAAPETEFANADKGDALYAMELALAMEKLNFAKLRELHDACDKAGDAAAADFVEGELLAEQTESVRKVAGMVAQLRRVGPGLGVFEFDRTLQ